MVFSTRRADYYAPRADHAEDTAHQAAIGNMNVSEAPTFFRRAKEPFPDLAPRPTTHVVAIATQSDYLTNLPPKLRNKYAFRRPRARDELLIDNTGSTSSFLRISQL